MAQPNTGIVAKARHLRDSTIGRAVGLGVRTATSIVKRAYGMYQGTSIEQYIAQKLTDYLDVNIALTTSGPIEGHFEDVKFKPLVAHILKDEANIILDLERTQIDSLDVKIDLEELFRGLDAQDQSDHDPSVAFEFDSRRALVKIRIDLLSVTAPGLKLQLKGLTIVLHHPDAHYEPEPGQPVSLVPDIPPLTEEEEEASPLPKKKPPSEQSTAHPPETAAEHTVSPRSEAASPRGAEPEASDVTEEDEDKLAAISATPGFAANVLSEWILKDVTIELKGFIAQGDLRSDALPHSKFASDFVLEISHFKVEHLSFYGVTKKCYEDLIAQGSYTEALKYHLMHMPLKLTFEEVNLKLGKAVQVLFYSAKCAERGDINSIEITVIHDNWEYFLLEGYILRFGVYLGPADNQHTLLEAAHEERQATLEFTFCTMLQRIQGNNQVLRRCYREDIGGEGYSALKKLQAEHQRLTHERNVLTERLKDLEPSDEEYAGAWQDVSDIRDKWELSRAAQERYFEKKFWVQASLTLRRTRVNLLIKPVADAAIEILDATMSWLSDLDTDQDGEIDEEEWTQAVNNQLGNSIDIDGDGEVSPEEWAAATGAQSMHQRTFGETLAEVALLIESLFELQALNSGADKREHDLQNLAEEFSTTQAAARLLLKDTDMSHRHLVKHDSIVQRFEQHAEAFQALNTHSTQGDSKTLSDIVTLVGDCATQFKELTRSMLVQYSDEPPLGVQLCCSLEMPAITYQPHGSDAGYFLSLGNLDIECPASSTEDAGTLDQYHCCYDKAKVTATGIECFLKDGGKEFPLLRMPPRMIMIIGWECTPDSLKLCPANLQRLTIDAFAQSPGGHVSSTRSIGIVLSEGAVLTVDKLVSAGAEEIRMSALNDTRKIRGFTLNQLKNLSEGIMVQDVYKQWLVPKYEDPNSIVAISVHIHFPAVLRFLGAAQVAEDGQVILQPGDDDYEEPPDIIYVMGKDVVVSLHGSDTFVSLHQLAVKVNVGDVKRVVMDLIDAIDPQEKDNDDVQDSADQDDEDPLEGTTLVIDLPSPYKKNQVQSVAGLQIKLVEDKAALDGITVTLPSAQLNLQRFEVQEVCADISAFQVRIDGLAAASILGKHYDNNTKAKAALFELQSVNEKLTNGDYIHSESQRSSLLKAIEDLANAEIEKGAVTISHDGQHKLDRVAIIAGEVVVRGRVNEDGVSAPWFYVYTPGTVPIWQLHGSLCDFKKVDKVLMPLISEHADQLDEEVVEVARNSHQSVIDAAIDYHDISFADTTVLVYLTKYNLTDLISGILGIVKHKPQNPCPDYLNFHLDNLRLDLTNVWPSLGMLNYTSGSLGTKGLYWKMTACQTKMWLLGLLTWVFVTLDFIPGLTSLCCFLSHIPLAMDSYDKAGGGRHWQYFVLILPKAVFLSLLFPQLMVVMTNRVTDSRFFFAMGGVSVWVTLLMWLANYDEIISYPFMWRDSNWNDQKGSAKRQMVIDCVMAAVLCLSMIAAYLRGSRKNAFVGFNRNLKAPYAHRQSLFYIVCGYYFILGILELGVCLSEKQLNEDLDEVDWVWPPDGADCNKVFFLMYSLVKLVTGGYLVVVAVNEKRIGPPSKESEDARAMSLTKKLGFAVILTWTLEFVCACLEHEYGPNGILLVAGKNLAPSTGAVIADQNTFWKLNFVYKSADEMSNTYCLYRGWHTFETTANLIWLFVCLAMIVFWKFSRQKEKLAIQRHSKQASMQIKRLLEPTLKKRQEMPCPPAYDAPEAEWIEWISTSGVAMTALVDVLGQEEGGKAAYKTAKDGIYGYRELATTETQGLIDYQLFGLPPKLEVEEVDEVSMPMRTPREVTFLDEVEVENKSDEEPSLWSPSENNSEEPSPWFRG